MAGDRLYEEMMRRALRLARRADGWTSPNPMVGAVVFNRDGIIAEGYHRRAGEPHAEIHALQRAGEKARGASLAINLEPCCHTGRTGPCTEAIIRAGIKEVVYSIDDPFEKVSGRGRRCLQENSIRVVSGVCAEEARLLNEAYLHFQNTERPFVVLKMAQTLDGRIATEKGESKWITGPEARTFAHRLRARYDAVAVGADTARFDNPSLTVRLVKGKNPWRIIISASGRVSPDLHLVTDNHDGKTIITVGEDEDDSWVRQLGIETWALRRSDDGIDLADLLAQAGKRQIQSILFEGGQRLATSLFKNRLVNKYYQFIAPKLIGEGHNAFGDLGVSSLASAITFRDYTFRRVGTDTLFCGYPE